MSDIPRRDPLGPMTMDELTLWTRAELMRLDQLHADAERKRQEMTNAGRLLSNDNWRTIAAVLAAGFGLLGTGAALAIFAIALLKMTGPDLAAALAALGLTQQQFAERVGVERVTVNRWCNGARRVPAWLTLALDNMQRKRITARPR